MQLGAAVVWHVCDEGQSHFQVVRGQERLGLTRSTSWFAQLLVAACPRRWPVDQLRFHFPYCANPPSTSLFLFQARGLEGAAGDPSAWEVRMASKYYKLLFKEYALADLSRCASFSYLKHKNMVSCCDEAFAFVNGSSNWRDGTRLRPGCFNAQVEAIRLPSDTTRTQSAHAVQSIPSSRP